ncbi:hypothetical protein CGCS363_v008429 [Colletotrichum siamense]|uniref:uncharacterized protein n=1 Tax=Colletotrichum siamense TaxID=690259 RepID=UPI0018723EF2|nr:uncharacterized protein CGCS363_v008429 [Colletotrichum siamense]KAF5497992.1 hypothetical protein CGCS363_v008429 [Colletotrichum siamense]
MTDLTYIKAFLLLPQSSNITTHFTLETPYGLIVELKTGEKLSVRLKENPTATNSQDTPDCALKIQPGTHLTGSPESHREPTPTVDTASDRQSSNMGYGYAIFTDWGTSGLWYDSNWPGNDPEIDFHIDLEDLEDRYPAAWLQAFARWIEQYDDSFVAGECHLSSFGVLFPDLEERQAWLVEGALLAAWLALQSDVGHVSYHPIGRNWELERGGVAASLAEIVRNVMDDSSIDSESEQGGD